MYRNITWFTLGYIAHKTIFPIALDVFLKMGSKEED